MALILIILLLLASVAAIILGAVLSSEENQSNTLGVILLVAGILALVAGCILLPGLKVINPKGSLSAHFIRQIQRYFEKDGFYWVNPFCTAVNPTATTGRTTGPNAMIISESKKISMKAITLNNEKQTVNDERGNPVIIGTIVIWRVVNTAKAVFNVNNYKVFLSTQCDSATRNVARLYPYDTDDSSGEKSCGAAARRLPT